LRPLVLFLLALHDIGKISRPFQAKAPAHWPAALGPIGKEAEGPKHDVAGMALLAHEIAAALEPMLGALHPRQRRSLLAPFMGHHGKPVPWPASYVPAAVFGQECCAAARSFVKSMHAIFAPTPLPTPSKIALAQASGPLAGFAILADWIGSSQVWFHYEPPDHSAERYWHEIARPRAREALRDAGLARSAQISPRTGFHALTGFDDAPSEVQRWAEAVSLPAGPLLALVEEVTGGGKTEAALVLAHRLMVEGRAKGLFVALPTMATANAMFKRVEVACGRLFLKGERPTLVLAHGRSGLHAGFRELKLTIGGWPVQNLEDERDRSGAVAPAWLADDRKKAFLADLGVGTIDQALLAVLTAKHQSLRLLGLADHVLIVDEAHAYDAYMQEELKRLLEFQAAQGGSAIVLSATLPQRVRRNLAAAFAKGLQAAAPTPGRGHRPARWRCRAGPAASRPPTRRAGSGRPGRSRARPSARSRWCRAGSRARDGRERTPGCRACAPGCW
jgi:CRISPR-associated endonuclease/helicase Cas3